MIATSLVAAALAASHAGAPAQVAQATAAPAGVPATAGAGSTTLTTVTVVQATPSAAPPPLATQVAFDVRWRNEQEAFGASKVGGTVDSVLGASGQLRFGPWLLAGGMSHDRAGVTVTGLNGGGSSAFLSEHSGFQLDGGYAFGLGSAEVAPVLAFDLALDGPTSQGVPFTQTPADWGSVRSAFGIGGRGSWEAFPDWTLDLGGAYYPVASLALSNAPYTVALSGGGRWEVGVRRRLVTGIHLGLVYGGETWNGSGGYNRTWQAYGVRLTYVPGEER